MVPITLVVSLLALVSPWALAYRDAGVPGLRMEQSDYTKRPPLLSNLPRHDDTAELLNFDFNDILLVFNLTLFKIEWIFKLQDGNGISQTRLQSRD